MAPVPPAFAGETQGAGQWTGGGRVLLHLQRDLQQSRCGEMARRSCLLPRGLLSMAHYLNINTILSYQQLAILGKSADHRHCAQQQKTRVGRAGAERNDVGWFRL